VLVAGDVWRLLAAEMPEATRAADALATVSRKHSLLLKFSAAAFIDGDRCLTDLAAKKHFQCKQGKA
jgi:hypothetical protein